MKKPPKTLATFLTDDGNLFVWSAVAAQADGTGSAIPLLWIHGPSGIGKSHLLTAGATRAAEANRNPLLLLAGQFLQRHWGTMSIKAAMAMDHTIAGARILFLDDAHLVAEHRHGAVELLYLIDSCAARRCPVILAGDKPPVLTRCADAHLQARLGGAVEIAIAPPGFDLRRRILQAAQDAYVASRPRGALDGDMLDALAARDETTPGRILAAHLKCATYADIAPGTVTVALALNLTGQAQTTKSRSIEEITAAVADFYRLDIRDFQSADRAWRIARPRQVAMALSRDLTPRSLPEIGKRFGHRDHTTVLHACRRVAALCESDAEFKQEVDFLRQKLARSSPPARGIPEPAAGPSPDAAGALPRTGPAASGLLSGAAA